MLLPTFAQLRDPSTLPAAIADRLAGIDPDAAHPLNLFRVHWFNDAARRGRVATPAAIELPPELTGVPARIVLALGARFPMIRAHKVLAAYGCLAPRVVTGQFDSSRHRAIWPSTGNYCRGGVAISKILGCRGVAVLPENMSQERFDWLDRWVVEPGDIIRTPGSESNVKEIYDACAALDRDPQNIIFNQFCEYGNYLVHRIVTGAALERVYQSLAEGRPKSKLAAFVSATGSAGTIAAGDHLKATFGSRIAAVEAAECPTLLYNGFGEHNIQGIGDKHVPLIHNVMNTDVVIGVSDHATDTLITLFNTDEGRAISSSAAASIPRWSPRSTASAFRASATSSPRSSSPNIATSVPTTSCSASPPTAPKCTAARSPRRAQIFRQPLRSGERGRGFGQSLAGASIDQLLEITQVDRKRMFNLGYFTWVEQQGVSLEDFQARAKQSYWDGMLDIARAWDEMIVEFNAQTGVAAALS